MIALQLNPFLEIVTPKGPALARIFIDYGSEVNGVFLASLDNGGKFLFFDVTDCRADANYTFKHAIPK